MNTFTPEELELIQNAIAADLLTPGEVRACEIGGRPGWSHYLPFPDLCAHEWVHYEGLTQRYEYCTKCDDKKE